ncbi:MAG: hypothetical protein AAF851_13200 [Myxococcota bacterium]
MKDGGSIGGASLGLLLGLLVALSDSPVVGAVVTALVALLAAFFGLLPGPPDGKESEPQRWPQVRHDRLIGFSLAMILSLGIGIWLKVTGRVGPGVEARLERYEALVANSESSTEAKRLVLVEEFGDVPPGVLGRPWTGTSGWKRQPRENGPLKTGSQASGACDDLAPVDYPTFKKLSSAYEEKQGDLRKAAIYVRRQNTLDEREKSKLLAHFGSFLCNQ